MTAAGPSIAVVEERPRLDPTGEPFPSRFWLLTGASGLSKLGNTFLALAVPWALLTASGSALQATLGLGVQYAPYLAAPLCGALMDRRDRRRVFLGSEVVQGGLVAVLPLLLVQHRTVLVFATLLLVGTGGMVSNLTTDYGLVPSLLSRRQIARGYGHYGAVTAVSRCVGPAIAGVVIASFGTSTALWVDAGSFLATAVAALLLPRRPVIADTATLRSRLATAVRAFRGTPRIPRLTLGLACYNLGTGALPAVVVLVARAHWHWSSGIVGALVSMMAGGTAVGAWLGGRLGQDDGLVARTSWWFAVCLGGGLLLMVPSSTMAFPALALVGVGEGGMVTTSNAFRCEVIDAAVAGRVNSLIRAGAVGLTPLSSVLATPFAAQPVSCLWFAPVALGSAVALVVWRRGATGRRSMADRSEQVR